MLAIYFQYWVVFAAVWILLVLLRQGLLHGIVTRRPNGILFLSYLVIGVGLVLPALSHLWAYLNPTEVFINRFPVSIPSTSLQPSVESWNMETFVVPVAIMVFVMRFAFYIRSIMVVKRLLRKSSKYLSFGKVSIQFIEGDFSPFSYWERRRQFIIVPQKILRHRRAFTTAVQHECRHIRQGDTVMSHVMTWLDLILIWNPFLGFARRELKNLQEFSCDEFLIGHKGVHHLEYGRMLIDVSSSFGDLEPPACASGMSGSPNLKSLKWRLTFMAKRNADLKLSKWRKFLFFIPIIFTSISAIASTAWLTDGHVTIREAEDFLQKVEQDANVPLYVDEYVVKNLNKYLTTDKGRKFMRSAIDRMQYYEDGISTQIDMRNMPKELLAIPLVESGYQNLTQNVNPMRAAGMWQIIPTTARRFGLIVDEQKDERLHITKSTRAALKYLQDLYHEFGSWHLALIAYNKGERGLRQVIHEQGTHDVTQLRRSGKVNDYLSKVMATMLILKKPELIEQ